MNEYVKLKGLNDLTERMLDGIDSRNEHLLYQTDKYLKISEDLERICRETEARFGANGERCRYEENRELVREQLERARRMSAFFTYVKKTKESLDALENVGDDPQAAAELDKKAWANTLRLKMAIVDIKKRCEGKNFAKGVDGNWMRDLYNASDKQIFDNFQGTDIATMTHIIAEPGDNSEATQKRKNATRNALRIGSIQQRTVVSTKLKEDKSGEEYTGTATYDPVQNVKELLKDNHIKAVIDQYQNAQKFWMGSDLSEQEEKESRRAFMECYEEDLVALYRALNVKYHPDQDVKENQILEILRVNGIDGMMRDYHDMVYDRSMENGEREPKNTGCDYLYTKDNQLSESEMAFRIEHTTTSAMYKVEANEAQKLGLKEFHKWIYRNCDKAGWGDAFGSNGSARGYLEDFMKAPYKDQIRALYMLETKNRRGEPPQYDAIKDYVPNLDTIKETMVSPWYKTWRRMTGKTHRWNKLKQCMDKIEENKPVKEKLSGLKKANKVSGMAGNTKSVIKAGETIVTIASQSSKPKKVVGVFGSAVAAFTGIINICGSVKKIFGKGEGSTKGFVETTAEIGNGLQALGNFTVAGADLTESGIRIANGEFFKDGVENTLAGNIAKHGGAVMGIISAIRSAGRIVKYWGKNLINKGVNKEIVNTIADGENYDDLAEGSKKKEVLRKLKGHGHAISGINHRKVVNSTIDLVQSSVGIAGGICTGALGIIPTATAATATAATAGAATAGAATVAGTTATVAGTTAGITTATAGVVTAATTLGIAGVALVPVIAMVKNKYKVYGNRRLIDSELYVSDKEKKTAIDRMKAQIERRLLRMPDTEGYKAIRKELEKLKNDEGRLLNHIRKNVARKQGCLNEKQLKNKMVTEMGDDLAKMYLPEDDGNLTDADRKLNAQAKIAAKNLISHAGGKLPKPIDPTADENQKKLAEQENVKRTTRGL